MNAVANKGKLSVFAKKGSPPPVLDKGDAAQEVSTPMG